MHFLHACAHFSDTCTSLSQLPPQLLLPVEQARLHSCAAFKHSSQVAMHSLHALTHTGSPHSLTCSLHAAMHALQASMQPSLLPTQDLHGTSMPPSGLQRSAPFLQTGTLHDFIQFLQASTCFDILHPYQIKNLTTLLGDCSTSQRATTRYLLNTQKKELFPAPF